MKTAMQQLIEWVKVNDLSLKTSLYNNELINKLKQLQEKEKEQIINAYINGYGVSFIDGDNRNFNRPIQYYNETYKPETI